MVVIVNDAFPAGLMERLDSVIYQEKQKILMTPHLREEIDYIVKDLARVRTQLAFDTFKHMLACKILQEGVLLYGSENLFQEIKSMLHDQGYYGKADNHGASGPELSQGGGKTSPYRGSRQDQRRKSVLLLSGGGIGGIR